MNSTAGLTLGTIGGGASAGVENTWFWQAAAFIARKVTSTGSLAGFTATMSVTSDLSTATGTHKTLMMKYGVSTASDLQSLATPGLRLRIGNDSSNYYYYDLEGGDTYTQDRLFKFIAIDPNIAAYATGTVGSPNPATLDFYAIEAQFVGGGAKDLNVGLDAIDAVTSMTIDGGTAPDPAGTFADLAEFDYDTDTRRNAQARVTESGLEFNTRLLLGSASATRFLSTNEKVVFLDNFAAAGYAGIDIDVQHASTVIDWSGGSIDGRGTTTTTDSRPTLDVTGANGVFTSNRPLDSWAAVDLNVQCTWAASISNSGPVDVGDGANLVGSSVLTPTVAANASGLIYDHTGDPDGLLDNMNFTIGANAHHAIEFGLNSPLNMTLQGQDFSGFNATDGQNDSTFHIKRTTGTVTINVVGVTGNLSYRTDGAIVVISQSVPIALTIIDEDGVVREGSQVLFESVNLGPPETTGTELINEKTTITGAVSASFTGTTPADARLRVRDSSGTKKYKFVSRLVTIGTNGFEATIRLERQPILEGQN